MQKSFHRNSKDRCHSLPRGTSQGAAESLQRQGYANGWVPDTITLCDRNVKNIWRKPELFLARIFLVVMFLAPVMQSSHCLRGA